ncbi:hypothetical protein [Undibacterium sp.]|uniref:hypothetical protein n=1 Tax=Undibacterium sp. TaxID=1914977 RepID=UPI00374D437F
MYKTSRLILASALVLPLIAHAQFEKQTPTGFRGMKWGASRADLGSLVEPYTPSEPGCYRKVTENLSFGGAKLEYIEYCYSADWLYKVKLFASPDTGNKENFIKAASDEYGLLGAEGEGDQSWASPEVIMILSNRPASTTSKESQQFVIINKPLADAKRKLDREKE